MWLSSEVGYRMEQDAATKKWMQSEVLIAAQCCCAVLLCSATVQCYCAVLLCSATV